MAKRPSELEAEAALLLAEAKRQRCESAHFAMMNADLAAWREKLKGTYDANIHEWKLVFFSNDYTGGLQNARYSYGPPLMCDEPWSSEKWLDAEQNMGGTLVAYASTAKALFPPDLSAARLAIFGFIYVICPTKMVLPKSISELCDPEYAPYVYGQRSCLYVDCKKDQIPSMFGIEKPDLENMQHVMALYKHCNEDKTGLQVIDQKIQQLLKEKHEYEVAWKDHIYIE